jgi:hypothetical protein
LSYLRYVPDKTGRFGKRPHYELADLDHECESVFTEFMEDRYGMLVFPIPTDALTKLIERDADDLDLYADLSGEGPDVEGVTDFFPGDKPRVRIASALAEQKGREHRLRTTLTHEYGHVRFHGHLWEEKLSSPHISVGLAKEDIPKCKRDTMLGSSTTDWMEWQAGYACGALLMPASILRGLVLRYFEQRSIYAGHVRAGSHIAPELERGISKKFYVSREAARVRLRKLGYVVDHVVAPSLFD